MAEACLVLGNTVCTAEAISDMLRWADSSAAGTNVSSSPPEQTFTKVLGCCGPKNPVNQAWIRSLLNCVVKGGTLFLFEPVTVANQVRTTA
jgi:hypothetical protein